VKVDRSLLGGKRKVAPEERRNIFVKQRAKTVAANTVSEYAHLAGVTNVLHRWGTAGWRTEFLDPVTSAEQNPERYP